MLIRLVQYLNWVRLSKVKYLIYCEMCECTGLQFHSVREPSINHDIWVPGSSVIQGVGFSLGSVLGKNWVLVWLVLAGFGLFLVCSPD